MVAEVIINSKAKQLNRTFDYNIPKEMESIILVVSKVLVPFGRFKKIEEAHVVKIKEKSEYEIVVAFKTVAYIDGPESFKYYHFVNAGNEDEFNAYISKCKELAFYDTGVSATYGDKLITLSTCEYSHKNGRMVVVAKKIAE